MTSTPAWPSEEFALAPAPVYEPSAYESPAIGDVPPPPDGSLGARLAADATHAPDAPATPAAVHESPVVAHDEAGPEVVVAEPTCDPPGDPAGDPTGDPAADHLADPAELLAARAHIADLQAKLAGVEEENRAFLQSLRHVAAAAEELLAEARTEAAAMRAEVEHDTAVAHAELDARRASIIIDSQREADRLLGESRATAHELVVVARADAREAVHEERRRAADDLEMLAALRERIAEERNTLSQFHTQLSGRLRYLMHSMLEFAEQNPALELGDPSSFAAAVLTGPQPARSIALSSGVDLPDADRAAAATATPSTPSTLEGDMHGDEAHLDKAFDAFFSNDIDEDPSRRWILED